MLKEVYEFNKEKNGFKYDEALEIKMYKEEVKEFFDANTTSERLDALVDCSYVRMGTMCKLAYNGKGVHDLPYDKSVESLMVSILVEELGQHMFDKVIRLAEDIVCNANAGKPNVLIDGKVSKDKNTIDATKQIEEMLEYEQRLQAKVEDAHAKKQEELVDSKMNP